MAEDRIRVLRVLEYVGSRSFVERSLELRTVKGRHYPKRDRGTGAGDYIQEAILGETAEILPADLSLTADELLALSALSTPGTDWKPVDLLGKVSEIVQRLTPHKVPEHECDPEQGCGIQSAEIES